jgi:proteic killer suppression protein
VRYRFDDFRLEKLYLYGTGSERYPQGIVDVFIRRVRTIEGARDERDLRALKSLHFEKLRGERNKYSIRLNKGWRLILTIEKDKDGNTLVLIEINNHYGD